MHRSDEPSVRLSTHPSIDLTDNLSVCSSVCLSTHPSMNLKAHMSVNLPVCLSNRRQGDRETPSRQDKQVPKEVAAGQVQDRDGPHLNLKFPREQSRLEFNTLNQTHTRGGGEEHSCCQGSRVRSGTEGPCPPP